MFIMALTIFKVLTRTFVSLDEKLEAVATLCWRARLSREQIYGSLAVKQLVRKLYLKRGGKS